MSDTLEAIVRGRVQGVGFRYYVQREAQSSGLTGWVANEPDGSVRCVASGPRATLEAFLERLRAGPPSAIVDRVDTTWRLGVATPGDGFVVRTGAHRGD